MRKFATFCAMAALATFSVARVGLAQEAMSDDQLKTFFSNKTLVYENQTNQGVEHAKRFYDSNGKVYAFHERGASEGAWDVKDGKICMTWLDPKWKPSCITSVIEKTGEGTYKTARANGTYFNFAVEAGDPHGAKGKFVTASYAPVSGNVAALDVKFASAGWNGSTVPMDGVCPDNGGKGESPSLVVGNIPAGADAIIVEFSDRDYAPHDNGGHGVIGYSISSGATTAALPSIPGNVSEGLPSGIWIEKANLANGKGYNGPCSGGKGKKYEADVKAVIKAAKDGTPGKLLGTGRITLGRY